MPRGRSGGSGSALGTSILWRPAGCDPSWHVVAREWTMCKVRRHPYHWTQADDATHYFVMLHRAKRHLAAEYLWREGSVMPDPISDDPAARRAWEVAKERFDAIHQVNKASLDEAGSSSRF